MAAAASQKESVSLSLFMEVREEDLSTMGLLMWAEGVSMCRRRRVQQNAWRKLVFEVQTWRQVRGPARAFMRETRDLDISWPQWHTLLFEAQVAVDMRVVCPQDVKKMQLKQAMSIGRDWAATRCEGLKAGVVAGTNPGFAAGRGQMKCGSTRKNRRGSGMGCRRESTTLGGWP